MKASDYTNQQLVNALLTGSDNLNRMQREINSLCNILIGLIKKKFQFIHTDNKIFCYTEMFDGKEWRIKSDKNGSNGAWRVCILLVIPHPKREGTYTIYSSTLPEIELEYIRPVHEALPGLIKLILDSRLEIDVLMDPILEASQT